MPLLRWCWSQRRTQTLILARLVCGSSRELYAYLDDVVVVVVEYVCLGTYISGLTSGLCHTRRVGSGV